MPGQAEGVQDVGAGAFGERMHDETRIAGRHVARDLGVLFFVADHIPHGGQAGGDAMQTGGDTLAEREVGERGHGTQNVKNRVPAGNASIET
jgi:hypothetical protein